MSKMKFTQIASMVLALGTAGPVLAYPEKPIELVCTTSPGSGAARWCQLMAQEMAKPLGVPVNVIYKSGGSNYEPTLYLTQQPADGYTIMHMSGSFGGYFNLPHFKVKSSDLDHFTRVEQTIYSVAVLTDKQWRSAKELIVYAKSKPGELSMGSNKVGSIHHQHHVALYRAAGVNIRFVPYQGTGDVVKDVLGQHLPVGFAQPGLWMPHVQAGKVRVLMVLNETRLEHPLFKEVPVPSEVGINYDIPHQWQGMSVKSGTPRDRVAKLGAAIKTVGESKAYKDYIAKQPHVVPILDTDVDKLNVMLAKDVENSRKFMLENGMIKK